MCMQVLEIFDLVRTYFPDANVFSSTFDAYTEELLAKKDELDLPVVTKEIGDTWIYGRHAQDPHHHCNRQKYAAGSHYAPIAQSPTDLSSPADSAHESNEHAVWMQRGSERCAQGCRVSRNDAHAEKHAKRVHRSQNAQFHSHADQGMLFYYLLNGFWRVCQEDRGDYPASVANAAQVPEHTWGPDVKVYLNDYDNWSNDLFAEMRGTDNYQYMEDAWTRQASYSEWAMQALEWGSSEVCLLHFIQPGSPSDL